MEFLKKCWQSWKRIAHAIGRVQTKILLTVFYIFVLGPVALIFKLIGKSALPYKSHGVSTYWRNKPAHAGTRGAEQYYQTY